MDRRVWRLIVVVTVFGVGHHVGWPLISEVTALPYSLGFYPVIALGVTAVYATFRWFQSRSAGIGRRRTA